MIPFSDVARAAFCPRQLYYVRRDDDRSVPPEPRARIALAFRYPELVDAPDATLRRLPIRRSPAAYRRNLSRLRDHDAYDRLVDPARERAFVAGRDCHGTVHKVLDPVGGNGNGGGGGGGGDDGGGIDGEDDNDEDGDDNDCDEDGDDNDRDGDDDCDGDDDNDDARPPVPVVVSPGEPPEQGVWGPQSVRAVAAAKALAWEHEREIPRAFVEYPSVGVVRAVRVTLRRTASYRRALRAARGIDGPPPRVDDDRCSSCAYRDECGVETRSLRSLLG
ncbi:hypothetical protein GRS48_10370 [Halorubrum sp. JWXQ-INN 858]|uniref:hypothetical protein n=1 Tax=Halorubrum sp. JWXQ-INN 858 TaxID=2690782 RepID=UPI0013F92700|nr:hypothetical protein [Halorubrum sp. JWXQ-INN 858]MWV65221.1 hypothetical protein [Halorubrum sp. JWXQ-INN 858]